MKLAIALSAALLSVAPVAAFAQDASTTGRGNGDKSVGPASENGDTTTNNTKNPGASGRSAYPDTNESGAHPPIDSGAPAGSSEE